MAFETAEVIKVGTETITVFAGSGECPLSQQQPGDRRVIDMIGSAARPNKLVYISANCDELKDWRAGRQPTLNNYSNIQVPTKLSTQSFRGRETEVIKSECDVLKKKGAQITAGVTPEVRDRIAALATNVAVNKMRFVGVVHEDEDACYAALLMNIKTEFGTQKSLLNVFALTVLSGKIMFLYRYQTVDADTVVAALQPMIAAQARVVKAHRTRNP